VLQKSASLNGLYDCRNVTFGYGEGRKGHDVSFTVLHLVPTGNQGQNLAFTVLPYLLDSGSNNVSDYRNVTFGYGDYRNVTFWYGDYRSVTFGYGDYRNVTFGYGDGRKVLDNVSFTFLHPVPIGNQGRNLVLAVFYVPYLLDSGSNNVSDYRNVTFGYGDGRKVLDNVSFTVEPNTSLALVGPTPNPHPYTMNPES